MTLQVPQSLSARFRRYRQDIASQDVLPTGLIETPHVGDLSPQTPLIRYSLPVQGLRYRSDAYRLPGSAFGPEVGPEVGPAPCKSQSPAPVTALTNDYSTTHRLHIQKRLQHRLAVAMAKGDQSLVTLLQRELKVG